ncbi:MAG: helix-turn-helix transcriptional regulator [Chitinophagaceae bacterium]
MPQKKNHELPPLNMEKLNRNLLSPLSDREFEITQLAYQGITNSQIAEKLFVSVNTVKTHLKNVFLKIDADSRLSLIHRLRVLMLK